MVALNNARLNIHPNIVLPIIIPASDLPDVTVASDGIVFHGPVKVSDSATAHEMALWWLAAERGIRAAAAERAEAARLRAQAAEQAAEDEAQLEREALGLWHAYCGIDGPYDLPLPGWALKQWKAVAARARGFKAGSDA